MRYVLASLLTLVCGWPECCGAAPPVPEQPAEQPAQRAPVTDARRRAAIEALSPWAGVELTRIPETHRKEVDAATADLADPSDYPLEGFEPWYMWEISGWWLGEALPVRRLYLERQPIWIIPGGSRARVTIFDERGTAIGRTILNTGWRAEPSAAVLDRVYDHKSERMHDILQINSEPDVNGSFTRQYYGIIDNEVRLLRIEDAGGKPQRNYYAAPNHALGPTFAPDSVEHCLTLLRNRDRLVRLQALTWLAGIHQRRSRLHPTIDGEPVLSEEPAAAIVADDCRKSVEIKVELERLAKDERDQWTRDAAEQALNPVIDE